MAYFDTKKGSLEESIRKAVGEKLVGGQKKLDKDKDGDIDAKDFAMLRKDAKKKKVDELTKAQEKLPPALQKAIKAKEKKDESFDIDEGKMKQMKSYIDDIAKEMRKNRMMKGFADKFVKDAQKTLDPRKSLEKVLPDYVPGKDIARLLNMGEEVKLDENASRAFDSIIKDGGIDKKDFQKAKQLYMKKDLTGLRKFIYNLDTAALEAVMDVISRNDSKAFMKMYPRSKGGEYMSSIAYAHRND